MKKLIIVGAIIFLGLLGLYYIYVIRDNQRLYATVRADFARKYPSYEFVDCVVGEGDFVVAYVHVRFKRALSDTIQKEIWQYWDTDSVWLPSDKYFELMKKQK